MELLWQQFCEELGQTARENKARMTAFFEFHGIFRPLGIEIVPLKGLDLLLRAYPSPGQRPMADCDLLIRQKDISAVMRVFEEHGFRRKPDEGLTYISPDGLLNFDILWDLWYLNSMKPLWSRLIPAVYEGHSYSALSAEDAFFYIVTYVTAHRGVLSPLLGQDLQFLLESEQGSFNWEQCLNQASQLNLRMPFLRGLLYASENGCTQIPQSVFQRLQPLSRREHRLLELYKKLVTEEGHPRVTYFFTWLSYPRLGSKLKLLREKLLPSKWESDIRWGQSSFPVYAVKVLTRPFYLLFRGLWILGRDLLFFLPRLLQ